LKTVDEILDNIWGQSAYGLKGELRNSIRFLFSDVW